MVKFKKLNLPNPDSMNDDADDVRRLLDKQNDPKLKLVSWSKIGSINSGIKKTIRRLRPSKRIVRYLSLAIILILIGSFYSIYKSGFFNIKEIEVLELDESCASISQITQTSNIKGKNFFLLDKEKIENALKRKFLCIEKVEIQKSFPQKIAIKVFPRVPVVSLYIYPKDPSLPEIDLTEASPSTREAKVNFEVNDSSVSAKFIVDIKGFIFGHKTDNEMRLPIVFIDDKDIFIGRTLPYGLINGISRILAKLNELQLPFKSLKVADSDLLVDGEPKLVFSLEKDISRQLASLHLILQKDKMDQSSSEKGANLRVVSLINLRFDKPVVLYSTKKN